MTDVIEAELLVIQKFVVAVSEAISQDNSPQAQEIKKMGVEVEQIVSSKLKEGTTTPIGASASVTQKTKALFNMFRTSTSYEPELMGGIVSVVTR